MAATPLSVIQAEVGDLGTELVTIGAVGIGIGAMVLALKKGWKTVTKFF